MSFFDPAVLPRQAYRRRLLDWAIALLAVALCVLFALIFQSDYHSRFLRPTLLSQTTWAVLAFMALVGWIGAGNLNQVAIRRRGKSRPDTPGRHLLIALTLPLLSVTAAFPMVTPTLWTASSKHYGVFAVISALAAFFLIPSVIRRLREATWVRSELIPHKMASTRPHAIDCLRATARAFADAGVLIEGEPRLLAHGDRDMHLELEVAARDQGSDGPAITVQLFQRMVRVSSRFGWLPDHVLDEVRERLPEGVELRISGRSVITLQTDKPGHEQDLGRAAALIVEFWQTRPDTDAESHLAGSTPGQAAPGPWTARARRRPGGRVTWTFDAHTLRIEDPEGDASIDLRRPFKLLVSRVPDGSVPMLALTIRQKPSLDSPNGLRADATSVGVQWSEVRLRVPLLWHDESLSDLDVADSTGPVLNQPRVFRDIWRRLYWAAVAHGERPVDLPDIALGFEPPEEAEKTQWFPGRTFSRSRVSPTRVYRWLMGLACLTGAAWGLHHLTGVFVRFPIWEGNTRGSMLAVVALSVLGVAALSISFATLSAYLRNAVAEVLALLDGIGLDTEKCTVHMPTTRESLRAFARRGRVSRVSIEFPEGLSATLSVWPAGYRAAGLGFVEQLELTARPGKGTALEQPRELHLLRDQLAQLHASIGRLDACSELNDYGPERVLSLQTRRVVGSGVAAWLSLRDLLGAAEDALPDEQRSALMMDVGLFVPPTLPTPSQESLRPTLRRPIRGATTAMLASSVATSVLAFPGVFQSDYAFDPAGSNAALAEACVEPLANEAGEHDLYAVLQERRCLLNANGEAKSLLRASDRNRSLLGRAVPLTIAGASCKVVGAHVRAAGQEPTIAYAEEMHRRLVTRSWLMLDLVTETPLEAAWGLEPYQRHHLTGEVEHLVVMGEACRQDPDMDSEALDRLQRFWLSTVEAAAQGTE